MKIIYLMLLLNVSFILFSCNKDKNEQNSRAAEKINDFSVKGEINIPPHIRKFYMLLEITYRSDDEKSSLKAGFEGDISKVEEFAKNATSESEAYFMGASLGGHMDIVKLMLRMGADANMGLCGAAAGGHIDIMQLMLKNGANPAAGLTGAAVSGNVDCMQFLLDKGANPNEAMEIATYAGHSNIVQLLLDRGANPKGRSIMWNAASSGNIEVVKLLVEAGADPNDGGLASAASNGHKNIVEFLLSLPGINVNKKTKSGDTPLDWALGTEHFDCADLIRAAGGKSKNEL